MALDHRTLHTSPEYKILVNLFLKVKKCLALIGDVKTIFELQEVNFPAKIFWRIKFKIWNEVLTNKTITVSVKVFKDQRRKNLNHYANKKMKKMLLFKGWQKNNIVFFDKDSYLQPVWGCIENLRAFL